MKIHIEENQEYDTGYHLDVTEIVFMRNDVGIFFEENRFPNLIIFHCTGNKLKKLELNHPSLEVLFCFENKLRKLKLNCPSLRKLICSYNKLTKLELDCPSLQELSCYRNRLTKLDLNCPSLQILRCQHNRLTNLNSLEFCSDLGILECSGDLEESVKILEKFIPNLTVNYRS
jgi:Leucine-rich repeat (LRR) protein